MHRFSLFSFIALFFLCSCGFNVNPASSSNNASPNQGGSPDGSSPSALTVLIVGGWSLGGVESDVTSSSDGETWTAVGTVALSDTCTVEFNNKLYSMGGYNGAASVNSVYESSDSGASWSPRAETLPSAVQNGTCAVLNNKIYYFGGTTANDWSNAVQTVFSWDGLDGSNWVNEGNLLPSPMVAAAGAMLDGTFYILGGYNGGALDTVYSTTNGLVFNNSGNLPTPRAALSATTLNSEIWIAGGGDDGGNPTDQVYSSPDGSVWTAQTALPGVRRAGGFFSIKGSLFYIGGEKDSTGTTFTNEIFSTYDGSTWNTHPTGYLIPMGWFSIVVF